MIVDDTERTTSAPVEEATVWHTLASCVENTRLGLMILNKLIDMTAAMMLPPSVWYVSVCACMCVGARTGPAGLEPKAAKQIQ